MRAGRKIEPQIESQDRQSVARASVPDSESSDIAANPVRDPRQACEAVEGRPLVSAD